MYSKLKQPLDGRQLNDYKMMVIISMGMVFLTISFYIGTTTLFNRSPADYLFSDYLTVNQIEDRIRDIRLQNQALEEELAQLSGSDSSN